MKKTIAYFLLLPILLGSIFFINSCKKLDTVKNTAAKPEVTLKDSRNKIIHLYNDTVYVLEDVFKREAGEQLIIDAGTLIKVVPGLNSINLGIIIEPGATILANGTSKNPIVFTANATTGTQYTNWYGITIKGKASNNDNNETGDTADNSGYLKYVRIEFASLMLQAVGSGTVVENVMVSYTNSIYQFSKPSAAFSFLGGSCNAKNLISYACGSAADFYITNGYNGKMQNIFALRHPFFGAVDNDPLNALAGVFIQNNANNMVDAKPITNPIISNLTVIGPNAQSGTAPDYSNSNINSAALITNGNARFHIANSLLMGFSGAGWSLGDSLTGNNILLQRATITNTIFHCTDTTKTFFIQPGIFTNLNNENFKNFMLQPVFKNQLFATITDFKFIDPFNYEKLNPFPNNNSPVLKGASFTEPFFKDNFFDKVNYVGAFGNDNWGQGWVNTTPLKTDYNFPKLGE